MSASVVKGWCPGALRPMQSGDGLVVRVRPFGGRLDAAQISGLARLAERHGNGLIDVTSRANLQIRGVSDTSHRLLLDGLSELALLDPDSDTESRRNILVTPFWRAGDTTQSLAAELEEALADSKLELPTKFGFAIDDGTSRVLAGDSADVRIERDRSGGLLVRADGDKLGRSVARGEAVTTALALANWFAISGGARGGRGRMAAHLAAGAILPAALLGAAEPAPIMAAARPGLYSQGAMVGVAFGQMAHATLDQFRRFRTCAAHDALADGFERRQARDAERDWPDHRGPRSCAARDRLQRCATLSRGACRYPRSGRGPGSEHRRGRTAPRLWLRQGLRPFRCGRHHSGRDRRRLRSRARWVDTR
ncbi:hypothetical protein ACVW0I_003198 [Bradyrhizobium sp. LM6.11]